MCDHAGVNNEASAGWSKELTYVLWRAQSVVHREVQRALDGLGVTVTQLGIAEHLREIGPLSASDLARGFGITPQSTTTALARLEALGWISRRPHPVHGRVVLNTLTPQGVAGAEAGADTIRALNARLAASLPSGSSQDLVGGLERLRAVLEPDAREPEALWPIS